MLTSCCWHLLYFQFDSAALADCFGTQIHERPDVTNSAPLSREFRGRIWWSFLEKCMYLSFWRYCECIQKKQPRQKNLRQNNTSIHHPFSALALASPLTRPSTRGSEKANFKPAKIKQEERANQTTFDTSPCHPLSPTQNTKKTHL